jgi:plastocyanin
MRAQAMLLLLGGLLSAEPAAADDAKTPPLHVTIRDHAFVPNVVHAKPGQSIVWENADQDPHTVTSGANNTDDGRWKSSPLIPDGETFAIRLKQRGKYPYFCKLHQYEASMHGTVVIE